MPATATAAAPAATDTRTTGGATAADAAALAAHSAQAHRLTDSTRVEIYVRNQQGAYTTTQVRGHTASCTHSALKAAQRLGQKLFGPAFLHAQEVCEGNVFTTRWWLHADAQAWASCAPDGTLHYGSTIPPMNTAVARGPARALRLVVDNMARMFAAGQAADNPTRVPRLVPGSSQEDRDEALMLWLCECRRATTPRASLGVVWEASIRRAVL
jgi:hypothetical protein